MGTNIRPIGLFMCWAIGLTAAIASGQPARTDQPGVTAMPAQKLIVTVLKFKGLVSVRNSADQPWQRPKEGMKLDGNAEFRTGPRSWVHFAILPNQRVTLDRLGVIKVITAVYNKQAGKVRTDLGMKYGRTRYDVEAAGIEHESTIHTPGNTLSVRGTKTFITNTPPYKPKMASYTGRVEIHTLTGAKMQFGRRTKAADEPAGETEQDIDNQSTGDAAATLGEGGGPLVVDATTNGVAETLFNQTFNTPPLLAQTPQEMGLDNYNQGAGYGPDNGGLDIDSLRQNVLNDINDSMFAQTPQSLLTFDFSWQNAADLDSFVFDPLGNVVSVFEDTFPNSVFTTPEGGSAGVDHKGPDGIEQIRWKGNNIPVGSYEYGLNYFSGQDSAPFQVEVTFTPAGGSPTVIDNFSGTLSPTNTQLTKTVEFTG